MNKSLLALSAVALTVSGAGMAEQPLTVQKLTELNKLHSAAVSPNGQFVVYGVKVVADAQTSASNDLYLLDLTKPSQAAMRLTSHAGGEHEVRWNSKSDAIYFLANRTGSSQVWRLALKGGEAAQVTDLPLDINGFLLSPDDSQLVMAIETSPNCDTLACTKNWLSEQAKVKTTAQVYDELMVRHWDTWKDGLKSHLFTASLEGKLVTDATDVTPKWNTDIPAKPFAGMEEVTFTPDSRHLVFSAKEPGSQQAWTTNFDLYKVSVKGGERQNLTASNTAWDSRPVFSADGRYLAYLAMSKPGFEADKFALKILDMKTGELKSVADQWDRSVDEFVFSNDNRTIFAVAQDVGQKSIFEVSTSFGDVATVYADGSAGNLQLAGDKLVFTRNGLDAPNDLFISDKRGGNVQQLTAVNNEKLKDVKFAEFEQFSFPGWNDETVYGYYLKPVNFEAGKKYPVAFLVHGGPQGSFSNGFSSRWNAQLWAGQGYGVVMIDFHGSTGYGQAFTDSISRDWGGKPLEDLKKGFAYITDKQQWLDKDRACALGASYGGYMMNWIAGNWTDGFKCLVNHAGLFDMNAFHQSTEELWFAEHEMGGLFFEKSEDYSKFNPANYVNNWQTPMLVIHGLKDFRVPYTQGLGAFTTLQRKGIDSRLVIFPDENHWILDPNNLVKWYDEVFSWMAKHTQ